MSEESSHTSFKFSVRAFLTKSDLKSICKFGGQINQGVIARHYYMWHLCNKTHRVMAASNLTGDVYLETTGTVDWNIAKLFQ